MEKGMYTGASLDVSTTPVDRKTAGQRTDDLAQTGARQMVDVLGRLPLIRPGLQPDEGVTYAAKIDKAEAHLDLSLAAEQVERAIRAFNPVPGAGVEIAGVRLQILAVDVTAESG